MKTEYSVECEVCGNYNISPIKCEGCWKKEVSKILDENRKCPCKKEKGRWIFACKKCCEPDNFPINQEELKKRLFGKEVKR